MKWNAIQLCELESWVEIQNAINKDNDINKFMELSKKLESNFYKAKEIVEKIEIDTVLVANKNIPLVHGGFVSKIGDKFKVIGIEYNSWGDMIDMECISRPKDAIVGIDITEIIDGNYSL